MPSTFDSALKQINRQTEEQGTQQLAAHTGLAYANLDDYPFNLDVLSLLPFEQAQQNSVLPYLRSKERLKVAIVKPDNDLARTLIDGIAKKLELEVEYVVVSHSSFHHALTEYARLVQEMQEAQVAAQKQAVLAEEKNYVQHIHTTDELKAQLSQGLSTSELFDALMATAYNLGASDVHLEPGQEDLGVRFRIDGVLQPAIHLPMAAHKQLISRIKMLGSLKLDEHNANQDGRFSMGDKGMKADVRVSMVPTGYGEGVVMRILRQDSKALSLEELGFSAHNLEIIEKAIHRPYGMVVVTGPTGSGKSTTLYAILQRLNTSERKIITLEDPIEYRIDGVQQSQVTPETGFTFAEGLKGALRQDPDIIMVGEIRDPETATIALNASLTGHLVLTTMHTNDAVSASARFLELGVEPFLLSGSINAIVAQRLVRVIQPGSTPEAPLYKGRVVIAECLSPTQEFEQAVQQHADFTTLLTIAQRGGMVPMVEDGLDKVRRGITSQSEVERVTAV